MKVILDSNALMIPLQLKIDIFSELERLGFTEFLIPAEAIRELEKLGRKNRDARVALELSKKCRVIPAKGEVDFLLIKLAKSHKASVLTNDRELRKILRKQKIPVVYPRQRKLESTTTHLSSRACNL
jgi:hypothetical protein